MHPPFIRLGIMTRIYNDSLEQEYKTNIEMLEEIKDKAYQAGRAYERKRILELARELAGSMEEELALVESLEAALKEPHKD